MRTITRVLAAFFVVPLAVAPLACTTESDADTDKAANDEADDDNTRDESDDNDDESDDDNVRADDADDDDEDPDASGDESDDDDSDDSDDAEGSGDFAAIWRQDTAQLILFDTDNPIPTMVDVEIPNSLPFPESEREVELFEQIKDGHHVTYAWVQGAPQYYRITADVVGSEDAYLIQQGDSVRQFTMEDGHMTSMTTLAVGTNIIQSFTTFKEYKGAFPPDGWPNDAVDAEIGADQ